MIKLFQFYEEKNLIKERKKQIRIESQLKVHQLLAPRRWKIATRAYRKRENLSRENEYFENERENACRELIQKILILKFFFCRSCFYPEKKISRDFKHKEKHHSIVRCILLIKLQKNLFRQFNKTDFYFLNKLKQNLVFISTKKMFLKV